MIFLYKFLCVLVANLLWLALLDMYRKNIKKNWLFWLMYMTLGQISNIPITILFVYAYNI